MRGLSNGEGLGEAGVPIVSEDGWYGWYHASAGERGGTRKQIYCSLPHPRSQSRSWSFPAIAHSWLLQLSYQPSWVSALLAWSCVMWPSCSYSLLSYLEMRFYGKLLVAISLSDRQQFAGYDQSRTLLQHKIYGNCFLFRAIFHKIESCEKKWGKLGESLKLKCESFWHPNPDKHLEICRRWDSFEFYIET